MKQLIVRCAQCDCILIQVQSPSLSQNDVREYEQATSCDVHQQESIEVTLVE